MAVQQDIRQSANEPQVEMATDISNALSLGESTDQLIPLRSLDISKSLSPFIILYDEGGNPVSSSVKIYNETVTLPAGVFAYTKTNMEDRITWEPKPGVRIATVVQHYTTKASSGFVLAGRNIREVEQNEEHNLHIVAGAWLTGLVVSLGLSYLIEIAEKK